MWATGRGELLELLPAAPNMSIVLVKPVAGVNTREAYRRFDLVGQGGSLTKLDWERTLRQGSVQQMADLLYNNLESASIQMVPEIAKIKQHLLDAGCYGALMSGSGSAVFGIAQGKQHAIKVAGHLRKSGYRNVWISKTVAEVVRG